MFENPRHRQEESTAGWAAAPDAAFLAEAAAEKEAEVEAAEAEEGAAAGAGETGGVAEGMSDEEWRALLVQARKEVHIPPACPSCLYHGWACTGPG